VSLERFISGAVVPITHAMDAIATPRLPTGRPALEGSLNDLRPVELLRLLGKTRQTGTLQVLADGPVLITLVDGAVSYATDDPNRTLRDVLAAEGLLDEVTWERATAIEGADLGDALAAAGVPEDAVARAVRRVVLDAVADLSLSPQGRFRFVAGRRHSLGERFHYPAADLDRDVGLRLDEWDAIRAVVPSFHHRGRLTPTLPDGRANVMIRAADWRVLVAVGHAPTLEAARAELGISRFALARSVATLVNAGALELHAPA
jgi:hypothetical protein